MSRWTFTLPIDLSSANLRIVNGKDRVAGAKYRRARDHAADMCFWRAKQLGMALHLFPGADLALDDSARTRRRVTIVRLMGKRQRAFDDDGMVAACKGLRDAMQRPRTYGKRVGAHVVQVPIAGAGIVWDDSAKWSEWRYAQERSADGRPGVRVEVENIEPARGPGKDDER